MPYKRSSRKKKSNLKAIIKKEIERNEDRKVEKKRFLGLLGQTFDLGGRINSIFGSSSGLPGGGNPDAQFYITLFQGPSATGTNQGEHDASTGTSAIRNFPSNYNISMIGDEIYLENLYMKYRVYKTPDAPADLNITCRVLCVELYDKLPSTQFELSSIFEYQHINYESGGNIWNGAIMSSINRQKVKRVFHDRTYVVNDRGTLGGVKVESMFLKLERKLIATQKGDTPASGLNMVSVESPGGTISEPNPNTYSRANQKELQTPHIYMLYFNDQPDDTPDPYTAIQACWTLRYSDM